MTKRTQRHSWKTLKASFTLALVMLIALAAFSSLPITINANDADDAPQASPAAIFTNPAAITIPSSGPATPYPSSIVVSGQPTSIPNTPGSVKVIINGFSHTFPDDVGFVLVGPSGAALNIQDGAGDGTDIVNVTYTISDTGATQLPDNGAWPAGTYKPAAYYTDVYPAPGPASYQNPGPIGGGTATFSSTFAGTNPNGTWNLFVVDFVGGDTGTIAGGWSLEIIAGPTIVPQHIVDFDGDGKTDPAVSRNAGGQKTWYIRNSGNGSSRTEPWGITTDIEVPEDYDGDGKTDVAVWRSGTPFNAYFYILQSSTNTLRTDKFGQSGDNPRVVGDYDGDGKSDVAVYRPGANAGDQSFWYYRSSVNGLIIGRNWGQNGDRPVPGDFDGDGRNDFVVQRNSGSGQAAFFMNQSTSGNQNVVFGAVGDGIVPGDYDGDQKTDIATVRGVGGAIQWNIRRSSDGATNIINFGITSDIIAHGDYDGDGKTDLGVWRTNVNPEQVFFFWLRSSDGILGSQEWGQAGDVPVAIYNQH
jgi:hypothetical protein